MTKGKTITTYLVEGNPKSIRTCFISNKVCKAVVLPRAKLGEVKDRAELQQPSLYILLNESDEQIYIGETESFLSRVRRHDLNKSFWDQAIVFVSKDNDLTKSDIKYLEYLAIGQAKGVGRYGLEENKTVPKPTNLPEHQIAFIEEFFDDVNILSSFLGIPVFEKVHRNNNQIFYCKSKNTDARGFYSENGFTVLKGSKIQKASTPSYTNKEARAEKLSTVSMVINENQFELIKDLTFKSPSAASAFCRGNSSNGWVDWVNDNGQTLDEVYRNAENKALEAMK